MPSYENARSTRLLATRCLCCGRPLCDAVSVDAGIGPVCRERHGYNQVQSESARVEANVLIHEAALDATTDARRIEISNTIRGLGFEVLADRIVERFGTTPSTITLESDFVFGRGSRTRIHDAFVVNTPYDRNRTARFNDALKSNVAPRYRAPVWTSNPNGGRDVWGGWAIVDSPENRETVWNLLRTFWGDTPLKNPAGTVDAIPSL